MKIGRTGITLFLLWITLPAVSQFYETGQDPASIHWKQINTSNYRLVFPSGFEKSALRFASTLDTIYPFIGNQLHNHPDKISVVFHTQTSYANGLVSYAPKRMELYTMPPQDNYPQDWLDQLALHEGRHVAQLDALKHGFTRFAYYLLGEQAVGGISGLVPKWFLEGDAVYSETEFSNSGRGRNSAFLMPYKALVLSHSNLYPYEKAMLGSYRDYVPDVYQMGYQMVKLARDSFSDDIFAKSLNFTAKHPYMFYPFGYSVKQSTGMYNPKFYRYTFGLLKNKWKNQEVYDTYNHWPIPAVSAYTSYNFPFQLDNHSLLAEKWSLDRTRHFVLIDSSGREKTLLSAGSINGARINVSGINLIWSENQPDLRWDNKTDSRIYIYNLENKKLRKIKTSSWYLSPALSPDGRYIACIEETPAYGSFLVILDFNNGQVIHRLPAPEEGHLQQPQWSGNQSIFCLEVGKQGKSLQLLDKFVTWREIIQPGYDDITGFCLADGALILAMDHQGTNNLFQYNMEDHHCYQITQSRYGAFEPSWNFETKKLWFTEYSSDGYRIATVPFQPQHANYQSNNPNWKEIKFKNEIPGINIQDHQILEKNYTIKSYTKGLHALNVHSWLPMYYNYSVSDIANPAIYPGLTLLSQDLLGTLVSKVGYSYRNGYSYLTSSISYKAWYPVITWTLDAGGPAERSGGNETDPVGYKTNLVSTVSMSLPLNLSRRNIYSALTPYVDWEYNRYAYYLEADKKYYQGLSFADAGLNYYRYTKMAQRDLYPRLGLSFQFRMRTTPWENKVFNSIFATSLRMYTPGFFKSHSFQIRYGYQYQNPLSYLYATILPFPAGYENHRSERMQLLNGIYAFPLVYPDIHLGPVFYLKRIWVSAFYNYAINQYHRVNETKTKIIWARENLSSTGIDIINDVHFLRISFPFQVGARIGYIPEQKYFFTQAIFSVNLVY